MSFLAGLKEQQYKGQKLSEEAEEGHAARFVRNSNTFYTEKATAFPAQIWTLADCSLWALLCLSIYPQSVLKIQLNSPEM